MSKKIQIVENQYKDGDRWLPTSAGDVKKGGRPNYSTIEGKETTLERVKPPRGSEWTSEWTSGAWNEVTRGAPAVRTRTLTRSYSKVARERGFEAIRRDVEEIEKQSRVILSMLAKDVDSLERTKEEFVREVDDVSRSLEAGREVDRVRIADGERGHTVAAEGWGAGYEEEEDDETDTRKDPSPKNKPYDDKAWKSLATKLERSKNRVLHAKKPPVSAAARAAPEPERDSFERDVSLRMQMDASRFEHTENVMDELAKEREEESDKIYHVARDIHGTMQDLHSEVVAQDPQIREITRNAIEAKEYARKGVEDIKEADKLHKQKPPCTIQ